MSLCIVKTMTNKKQYRFCMTNKILIEEPKSMYVVKAP